ncbi:MAG TPA: TonB-dependent receptor [Thermoanaerobaculia bacterium]|nr:TonB-dependent receptor [Thermoanaerobaculia bacterium]
MKNRSFAVLIALLALVPTVLMGQAQTTGSLTGTVTTEAGAPVAGAEVTVSGPAIQGERVTRTNSSGQFTARLLPPGQYVITVNRPGLQPAVISVRVGVGETVPVNVTLRPGDILAEEITVRGRISPLQTPETQRSFDYTEEVEELPIVNRNINMIALRAPNTSFGPNAGQVAIAGAPSYDTVTLLDGAEISDPYFGTGTTVYLEDSVQEVQVLTTGISARYGRFSGGVINAVTKSGGNEFTGILRAELENQSWNSKTPFGETQADNLNQTYQGTLGGYLMRDRLWFFGGYRTIPETATAFTTRTTSESFTSTSTEERYQLKLRGAITPNHTVDVSYLQFDAAITNRAGLPAGDLFAVGNRTDPREMTSATYQGVLGYNTFLDGMYTKKDVSISSGGSPTGGDPFLWTTAGNWVYNNHWWDATDPSVRNNETLAANLSHSLDLGAAGTHQLLGGVQRVESVTAGDNRQSATGYNLVAFTQNFNPRVSGSDVIFDLLTGESQRWVATNLRATNTIENTALYLQDTMHWGNFRLDLGLRYDMYQGTTTGVQAFDLDFSDISPRLGLAYNITPGLQVLGTWGKYVGRFNDNWAGPAAGVSSAPREVYIYTGPNIMGGSRQEIQAALRNDEFWQLTGLVGDPAFPTTWMSSDAKSPYANELNLSLRSALPRNSGFAALTYTNRVYKNLMTAFVGLACSDFGRCEGTGDRSALPGNRETDTSVYDNDARTKRDYDALSLQFDYRPTARLGAGGSWTWSETKGNYEGEALNQPASGSVHGSREREFPLEFAAPYGFLNPHITHRANVYTTYRFDFGGAGTLSASGLLNYRSGRVWNRTASVPRTVEPAYATRPSTTYVHFFDGRGNNEFNDVWSLDTGFRYALPLFRGIAPFVKLDVLNVLDNDTLIGFQTTGTSVLGSDGVRRWAPTGNATTTMPTCHPDNAGFQPSKACTGFGRIRTENDYQTPREFRLSVGLQF